MLMCMETGILFCTIQLAVINMKYSFDSIKEKRLLLYEYIRGSKAYGLQLPTSDEDRGAVFTMDVDDVLGISVNKVEQVSDERNDTTWYELGKFMDLLSVANPNALEALFVNPEHIVYMHPAFKCIYDNRQMFVTKDTFKAFTGYAISQIKKARGLNKMIVNPVNEKKDILDFCYTFKNQGTEPFKDFLNRRGLKAKYCGLVHLPNMEQMYGVYYDWGNHELHEPGLWNSFAHDPDEKLPLPIGYRGAMDENNETTQLRLSSVKKNASPICYISFNENGFKTHCRQYKEYKEWVAKRNPQRYLENKEKEFDRKNMMHCARLLAMGIEIAETGKVNVDRSNIDRDFLLNIRLGNTTYDKLMEYLETQKNKLDEIIDKSTLPDHVDLEKLNALMISARKNIYSV